MRPVKRAIILCWIMLVACFAIKLFGGNWFEVVCTNEHFVKLCDFIENNKIVFEVISFFVYVFPTIIIVLSFSRVVSPTKIQFSCILAWLILIWASKFINMNLKTMLEVVFLVFSPIFINYFGQDQENFFAIFKRTWYYGIVGYVIALLFQLVSLLTRNIGLKIISKDVLTTFIMLTDYYIMLVLYYLYVRLMKGKRSNG